MPAAERATRAPRQSTRRPIAGRHDPLEISGGLPDFYYRWVDDESHEGTNIQKYKDAGYTFADRKVDKLKVGAASIHIHDDVGSHIRVSAGRSGGYLYYMKLPMHLREEDLAAKQAVVKQTTESMYQDRPDGAYGSIKIE